MYLLDIPVYNVLYSQVCSNYSPVYVKQTFPAIQMLEKTGGNAIFTFPMPPLKCPGAPQKISYMTDDYLRKVLHCLSTPIQDTFYWGSL